MGKHLFGNGKTSHSGGSSSKCKQPYLFLEPRPASYFEDFNMLKNLTTDFISEMNIHLIVLQDKQCTFVCTKGCLYFCQCQNVVTSAIQHALSQ